MYLGVSNTRFCSVSQRVVAVNPQRKLNQKKKYERDHEKRHRELNHRCASRKFTSCIPLFSDDSKKFH